MPAMASLSKQSSGSKPKLDRRNARKISDYEPSDSPRAVDSPSPSSYRTLGRGSAKSYRLLGRDSRGEIEKICQELGISGGADAFSIPQDDWKEGMAKSGALGFIVDQKSSPLATKYTVSPSPVYNSMSSPSGDSFTSESRIVTGGKGLLGSVDPPVEVSSVASDVQQDHQRPRESIQGVRDFGLNETQKLDDYRHISNVALDPRITEARDLRDHQTEHLPDHKQTRECAHQTPIMEPEHYDSVHPGNDIERVVRNVEQTSPLMMEGNQQMLESPPASRLKADLHTLSTDKLVAGFGPKEGHNINREMAHHDSSRSDSKGSETVVEEDNAREEEFSFVSEVVQQLGDPDKEQNLVEEVMSMAPLTPEHNEIDISSQSWRKLDMLGSGSFGTVYEGMSEDGIYFAVKEVSLSEHDSKAQQCVTQLEQEIEFLSKFKHENIVRYLGTQKEPDRLYIFLELVTKGSLSSVYQKYTLFESQIRSYTRQILNGLKYLHERNIVHRDIKCANILVDVNGKIKVADFGLAKQISQLDELKSCKGSAYWMAPEVIDPKKTYSFPADIWSLGCTVLEMETRRPPFGDMEWHRAFWKVGHGEAPPIPETLSEDARDFIRRCLEVNPMKRPSASQLLDHPFVQYAGMGLTPRNSFTQENFELPVILEDKTLEG